MPGPCPIFLVSAVLRGGKRQFGGKVAYAGAIRNAEPLLCCQGALARHLMQDYNLDRKPFPDPSDKDLWRHTPLWSGNNPRESISYTQHADSLKEYLEEAGECSTCHHSTCTCHGSSDCDYQACCCALDGCSCCVHQLVAMHWSASWLHVLL